ncbi:hypothetical protein HMPREF9504_02160 [Enterococcus faecalis TX0102]|uniref:Uncharacterized protein n=1 Tax=Enterococcus faecalis TX4248 TaxID=749495 RepID=A0A125W430_ENTFL|nr:hypothetical protein HMPREF9498_02373 [Enterococcus faecalis TX4248]EFQ12360.1 hypothetical protein HMPREF9504_02160 [Enterococcus faecalis TX0102]EFT37604.1 hypothetical protein HMPREF9494_02558 [Enterococcus faecalis TX2137]EFT46330.1 hypothetical protein HMPREF9501_02816 [Enterococcus faecalis TX0027]EFT97899.1 hypothetical protein HMPREF9502_00615 [Enterococcus faecalis TX0031]EFU00698.1 hypothetical protein HMPREF9503_00732 [Enterococcus faecalis TX0043]EGG58378.1 hypothetical protein
MALFRRFFCLQPESNRFQINQTEYRYLKFTILIFLKKGVFIVFVN